MANQFIKVKSVSPFGVKYTYVPLTDDEDFRRVQKNAWAFRLSAEFKSMKELGWSVGFFTLTYNDQHLPFIPECCWSLGSSDVYQRLPAFNRHDVQDFLLKLRKHLSKVYRIEQVKYMICSEFGSSTQRPHYHGVICWPEYGHKYDVVRHFKGSEIHKSWTSIPCSDKDLHDAIRRIWEVEGHKGFVRPWHYLGGTDSHGHIHKPFKVEGDYTFCCKYAGKYCCKDLYFYDHLKDFSAFIDVKSPLFRKLCAPFHLQSKSLGASLLDEMKSDAQKMDLLLNGYAFMGSDKFMKIPVYIRNKLVFDNYYEFDDDGNRLVRRKANAFFIDNYKEIYEHKADFYAQTFKNLLSPGYLEGRGVDADNADYVSRCITSFIDSYNLSLLDLSHCYLSYYGVEHIFCYDQELAYQWLCRYFKPDELSWPSADVRERYLIDKDFYLDLDYVCTCIMFGLGLIPVARSDALVDRIHDFVSSEVG